jgi:hypothetical protein
MAGKTAAELGELLRDHSCLPYEQAWSMPRAFYTDPKVLAVEKEQLFGCE